MKRTTTKLYGTLLTMLAAFILISSLVLAALIFTDSFSVSAQAKTKKPYKTKTVKLVESKKKTWYPAHETKIKKIKKVSKNKSFSTKIVSHKTGVRISGTDRNTKQVIKIYFANGKTQKVNLKTKVNYLNKIKAELKPMLADPDNGIKTAVDMWKTKTKNRRNAKNIDYTFSIKALQDDGPTINEYTLDETLTHFTKSQKKAIIMELYLRTKTEYSQKDTNTDKSYTFNRNSNKYFKLLYNGKFTGACEASAWIGYDICKSLGIKCRVVHAMMDIKIGHAWLVIKATEPNGTAYWHGVYASSSGHNMKASMPSKRLTNAEYHKYLYNPSEYRTYLRITKSTINPTTPTTPPAVTASAIKCPGCPGKLSHLASNPYKSMCDGAVMGIIPMGSTTKYHPHNGGGVIRFFDDYGNEWLDVPPDVKQRYEALYL